MKSKFLSVFVALAVMLSACDKDSPAPVAGEDDVAVEVKGFQKLGGASGEAIAYSWNGITASDFASLPTPPFNNFQKVLGTGITVFRSSSALKLPMADFDLDKVKLGNGNDPVYLWFDESALENEHIILKDDEVAVFYVGVRYKASNNVIFEFDVEYCIEYCAENGPISLQWTDFTEVNLGDITQVRIGPIVPKPVKEPRPPKQPKEPKEQVCIKVFIELPTEILERPVCGPDDGKGTCPSVSLGDLKVSEINLGPYKKIVGWLNKETNRPFENNRYCKDVTLIPVIRDVLIVTILDETGKKMGEETIVSEDALCPVVTSALFDAYKNALKLAPHQKFDGWWVVEHDEKLVEGKRYCEKIKLEPIILNAPEVTVLDQDGKEIGKFRLAWDANACPSLLKSALNTYKEKITVEGRFIFSGWKYQYAGSTSWEDFNADGIPSDCKNITVKANVASFVGYTVKSFTGECISNLISNTYQANVVLVELYEGGVAGKEVPIRPRWGGTKLHDQQIDNVKLVEAQDDRYGCGGNYPNGGLPLIITLENGIYTDTIHVIVDVSGNKLIKFDMVN